MNLLDNVVNNIYHIDKSIVENSKERLLKLAMPKWALGRLLDLGVELSGIYKEEKPKLEKKCIVVMAGDHGVVAEGVSPYPQVVTLAMIKTMIAGGAGINAMAKSVGADVKLVNMGVAADLSSMHGFDSVLDYSVSQGTQNLSTKPAMTKEQAINSIEGGIKVYNKIGGKYDIFGIGEMGIGNTTPASAIISVITGHSPEDVTGRGTGLDDEGLKKKINIIEKSLNLHEPNPKDTFDILSKIGGFEIGGMAGFILACAADGKAVVIDGLISTAAALIAHSLCPASSGYMIASHKSVEKGHKFALEMLKKEAYLDLNFRLGEGTGAALMMNLISSASSILDNTYSLDEAMALMGPK